MRAASALVTGVLVVAAAAGCRLQEVTIARPDELVVAEVYLRAGSGVQHALLHPAGAVDARATRGAEIEIRDAAGHVLRFAEASMDACLARPAEEEAVGGTCYRSRPDGSTLGTIREGRRYALRVVLASGDVLRAATRVPAAFDLRRPSADRCTIAADPVRLTWTVAGGAWAYLAEAEIRGIAGALAARGIEVERDTIRLRGLSVSERDTTITFPEDFGLFDRMTLPPAALAALREGLPEGATGEVVIAAVDRNYVNWARGGAFHPSGRIRVASVEGEGTGVFASIVPRSFRFVAEDTAGLPPCGDAGRSPARQPL